MITFSTSIHSTTLRSLAQRQLRVRWIDGLYLSMVTLGSLAGYLALIGS